MMIKNKISAKMSMIEQKKVDPLTNNLSKYFYSTFK